MQMVVRCSARNRLQGLEIRRHGVQVANVGSVVEGVKCPERAIEAQAVEASGILPNLPEVVGIEAKDAADEHLVDDAVGDKGNRLGGVSFDQFSERSE